MKKKKIAIFASGNGSNAQKIIEEQSTFQNYEVSLIVSNNSKAGVLEKGRKQNIETYILSRNSFYESEDLLKKLQNSEIDVIILAGFLWLIPAYLIKKYNNQILNIHPSLLPKYGGKGMYGKHVHQAVFDNQEQESGITIHLVNEEFDKGKILFQEKINVEECTSAAEIAKRVLKLEHLHFPRIISQYLNKPFFSKE